MSSRLNSSRERSAGEPASGAVLNALHVVGLPGMALAPRSSAGREQPAEVGLAGMSRAGRVTMQEHAEMGLPQQKAGKEMAGRGRGGGVPRGHFGGEQRIGRE